jgi:hypothetical protein
MNTLRIKTPVTNFESDNAYRLTRRGKRVVRLGKTVAGLAVVSGVIGMSAGIYDVMDKNYTYSESTHSVTAGYGDGLEDIAGEIPKTGEAADLRDIEAHLVKTNPSLANGLDSGESVVVPDSVDVS